MEAVTQPRLALVTGGGRGIGAACARALADDGYHVWVNDLDADAAADVAHEIKGVAIPGDVAAPRTWLGPLLVTHGALGVLVHCAGFDVETALHETSLRDFDRLHRVMVRAPFELGSMLLPKLRAAHGASIIFISSVQASQTYPRLAGYAAAKAAQIGMVKSLALELGSEQVRVLAVSPGYIDTRLMDAWAETMPDPAAARAEADALHPLGRIGKPSDVGALVAFLASPAAEFINGTNIVIDGGLAARYP